jgi:hypothetical protein
MGQKLVKYYELVSQKGGLQAKMRLAMKTAISSEKAASADDSPENLAKFYDAVRELLGPTAPKL